MNHLINWVEIPATDLSRAVKFYKTVLGIKELYEMEMNDTRYALFPTEDKFNCGAIAQGPHHKPSADGPVIYLDGGADMDLILKQVEKAGGQVLMAKTYTGKEAGFVGMLMDTERNKIGLQHA